MLGNWPRPPALRTLYEWSRTHDWQGRIADLERSARREQDAARIKALHEMYDRQAREGLLLQQLGAERLTEISGEDVKVEVAIRAIVEGSKLERLARGEPGDRAEIKEGDDDNERFASFSDEQLRALAGAAAVSLERDRPPRP